MERKFKKADKKPLKKQKDDKENEYQPIGDKMDKIKDEIKEIKKKINGGDD